MAIVLPKDRRYLIGFRFRELIPFEMNTFSLDTILPPVFRLAVLEGSESSRGKAEGISSIDLSVERLINHPRVIGFKSDSAAAMTRKLAQATLFEPIKNARSRQIEIAGLIPYTIAPFAVGLPTNAAGFRQVDLLLFNMLVTEFGNDRQKLRRSVLDIFGTGLDVRGIPKPSVSRLEGDWQAIDVISELSIAFAEGFPPIAPRVSAQRAYVPARPLPTFQQLFGRDLYRFLQSYADLVPRTQLIRQIISLIAFELSVFTVRLFERLPAWRENPQLLLSEDSEHCDRRLFVDFTGDRRHLSRSIATRCVRRDIESIPGFIKAVLDYRYLDGLIGGLRSERTARRLIEDCLPDGSKGDSHNYLDALVKLAEHPDIEPDLRANARQDLHAIRDVNRVGAKGMDDEPDIDVVSEVDLLIDELSEMGLSSIEQVQDLLFRAQLAKTSGNLLGWFRDVTRASVIDDGLVSGESRNTWCYAPSNDLLMVLVQLFAVDDPGWKSNPTSSKPTGFSLQEFLEWLEDRFGIIVDRPPDDLGLDGPEYATAARDNLQAMLRRLRQMGMFEDQSDDFSVQQITPPFMDTAVTA